MENARIAAVFEQIADILEILGENPFRIRSYRNAARPVGAMPAPLAAMVVEGKDLTALPGIGESLAARSAKSSRAAPARCSRTFAGASRRRCRTSST